MGKHNKKGSINQQGKRQKALEERMQQAAGRGAERFNNYGGQYTKMTYADLAKFDGFGALQTYRLSERDTKYLRDTTTGWQVILDLSRTYFRVTNADGEYVGTDGTVQQPGELDNDFLERSHFKTK